MIVWEIPEEMHNDEPMTISKFYTLSLHEKSNLGADLSSWRGRAFSEEEKQGFDISTLLNVPCMLNIVEGKNGKSRVSNIMPLAKGDNVNEAYNDLIIFLMEDFQTNKRESFNQLSDGIRNIILKSKELENFNKDMGDGANDVGNDDDVPF
jgi:hypothetical protein